MNRKEIEALSATPKLHRPPGTLLRIDGEARMLKNSRTAHEGRGWFDPLSDAKGDVFGLVEHLDHVGFLEGAGRVADLVGFTIDEPEWQAPRPDQNHDLSLPERWQGRRYPWPGSSTWAYLSGEHGAERRSASLGRRVLCRSPARRGRAH
ncbi:hypothetical protein ABIA22_004524 [Sinorhizobium fredii]